MKNTTSTEFPNTICVRDKTIYTIKPNPFYKIKFIGEDDLEIIR